MRAVTTLGAPLTTSKRVVAAFGSPTGAQLTVIYDDGTVLERTAGLSNDWTELVPIPLTPRAATLDTYSHLP